MAERKRGRLAGASLLAAGVLLFGKETLLWAWNKALDTFSSGVPESGMSLAALPWHNMLASVLTLSGLGLLLWPSKKGRFLSRADRLKNLQGRGWFVTERIRHDRALEWFEKDRAEDLLDITRDGVSLLMDYAKEGLAIPDFGHIRSAEKVCVGIELYLSTLRPFMRDGHVGQVDAMAKGVAERALATAAAFNPEKWHVTRYGL